MDSYIETSYMVFYFKFREKSCHPQDFFCVAGCSKNPRIYLAKDLSISKTNDKLPNTTNCSSETQVREKDVSILPKARFPLGDFVRGEFFRQPIITNHGAGFLFSLRVAPTKSPSGKRA